MELAFLLTSLAMKKVRELKSYFLIRNNPSIKKQQLYWVISAKRQETREKRVMEIAEHSAQNRKPKQFG